MFSFISEVAVSDFVVRSFVVCSFVVRSNAKACLPMLFGTGKQKIFINLI